MIKKTWNDLKRKREEELINEVMENSRSTKRIKKELSQGTKGITHLVDEKGKEIYNRNEINKLATEYYKNLYRPSNNCREKYEPYNLDEVAPFTFDEIKAVTQKIKKGKAPG